MKIYFATPPSFIRRVLLELKDSHYLEDVFVSLPVDACSSLSVTSCPQPAGIMEVSPYQTTGLH